MKIEKYRLIIVRHAESNPGGASFDILRTLSTKGRTQCEYLGPHLSDVINTNYYVYVSAAVRTQQTWELLKKRILRKPAHINARDDFYKADVEILFQTIKTSRTAVPTILLISHEPAISGLVGLLVNQSGVAPENRPVLMGMPTACAVVIDSQLPWDQWEPGQQDLVKVIKYDF